MLPLSPPLHTFKILGRLFRKQEIVWLEFEEIGWLESILSHEGLIPCVQTLTVYIKATLRPYTVLTSTSLPVDGKLRIPLKFHKAIPLVCTTMKSKNDSSYNQDKQLQLSDLHNCNPGTFVHLHVTQNHAHNTTSLHACMHTQTHIRFLLGKTLLRIMLGAITDTWESISYYLFIKPPLTDCMIGKSICNLVFSLTF